MSMDAFSLAFSDSELTPTTRMANSTDNRWPPPSAGTERMAGGG